MLNTLDSLHQDVSQVIILIRELLKYEGDFTPTKKAECQAEIKHLLGNAQRKMATVEDHRSHGTWESSTD